MEFLYYVCAIYLGWFLHGLYLQYIVKKAMKSLAESIEQKIQDSTIVLKLEKKGDTIFAFDANTDKFLTQGTSIDEVKENLRKEYPENGFNATKENMQELGLL